jgi:hypothetical protein
MLFNSYASTFVFPFQNLYAQVFGLDIACLFLLMFPNYTQSFKFAEGL